VHSKNDLLTTIKKAANIIIDMKKLTALGISTASYLSLASHAFAQRGGGTGGGISNVTVNPCPQGGGQNFNILCGISFTGNLISDVITIAFIAAALLALAFLIFGGIKWITSGGDKGGVESARNMIVAALIGLVITFLAYFLIRIIFGIFGLNFGNFTLPTIG
jgi:hypothetical protein